MIPNYKTVLSETATLEEIAAYIFDNYNNDPEFLAALNYERMPFPDGVQEVLDAHDVLVDELLDAMTKYIQTY
jgi:hypothetical protein